jgi:hypothetical protein
VGVTTEQQIAFLTAGLLERYDITLERALEIAETLVLARYEHQRREFARGHLCA